MRALISVMVCLGLTACAPSATQNVPIDDDRFDLLRFHMPDLLAKDARQCVETYRALRGYGGSQDTLPEDMFEKMIDLWQVVDDSFLSDDPSLEVLPNGGNPDKIESILPKVKLPAAVSHACGEYAGQVAVKIGLLSVSDSVDLAIAANPDAFDRLGVSLEQVRAGLSIVEARVDGLSDLSVDDKVQCVVIYQSAQVSDAALGAFVSIWVASLVDAIESGELNPVEIRERSAFWRVMVEGGADAVVSSDGFQAMATECDAWMNDAISKQAAK